MKAMTVLMALFVTCFIAASDEKTPVGESKPKKKTSVVQPSACVFAQGDVVAISADTMTLRDHVTKKVIALPLHPTLADDKLLDHVYDGYAYLRSDIRVGDFVGTHRWKDDADSVEYWVDLQICRRPGGRVPPSVRFRESNFGKPPAYHEWANVYNDLKAGVKVPDDVLRYTGFLPPLEAKPIPDRIPPAKK